MRLYAFVVLCVLYSVECRKVVPINKNANIDFINMEAGGNRPPNVAPAPVPLKPREPTPAVPVVPAPLKPTPAVPVPPAPAPHPVKPSPTAAQPVAPTTIKQTPSPVTPKPVNPKPAASPITTPGPGSVKQLVTFYDSQGKGSPIRPYTYSQAVKQG